MPAKKTPHITAAELRIMKVLWGAKTGTVRDVLERLAADAADAPAYTTVMTLMNQLAGKDALNVDKSRQPFVYTPAVRREHVLRHRLRQFINQVYDGQVGELVLRLVEEADLSPEELKRIEAGIEAREQGTSQSKSGSNRDADEDRDSRGGK